MTRRTTTATTSAQGDADVPRWPGRVAEAGISSVVFWASLAFALAVAFVVTWPINRWFMGKGKGHAVVHACH